jgi:RNA polymerase sigma-70 factor (ECF subfamily)
VDQREIVARAREGDRDAFDVLVAGNIDRLYAIAQLILRDRDLAEDAAQDALIHCWRELPRLRDVNRFDSWLRRLLVNAATDQFRRRRRFFANVRVLPTEPSVDDSTNRLADREQLDRGFRRLRVEHRTTLVLHHYLGLSAAEVAQTLGIPVGTARSRLHYATEAMRAALEADARGVPVEEVTA